MNIEKLEGIKKKYDELTGLIVKPEIIADNKEWTKLVKEHSQVEPVVTAYARLVDTEKEIARLNGELDKVEDEIRRASGKLANAGFLDKAPKQLVEAERDKLNKYIDMREKIKLQIADLQK